jgi:hypothetical protein
MENAILIADNVRGIYATVHAAKTVANLCNRHGWTCTNLEAVTYATQGPEEAMETFADVEAATFTNPQGEQYTVEQTEGGDVFLIPTNP